MSSEAERVERLAARAQRAEQNGIVGKWIYHPVEKVFRLGRPDDDPDKVTLATPGDTIFSGAGAGGPATVVLFKETFEDPAQAGSPLPVRFAEWDGGEVYTQLPEGRHLLSRPGSVLFGDSGGSPEAASLGGAADDCVRVVVNAGLGQEEPANGLDRPPAITAFVKSDGAWRQASLQLIPLRSELFSRHTGLLESSALSEDRVLVIGLGTVGAYVSLELGRSGVQNFALMDHDCLEVHNIARHVSPLSHVRRHKTRSVRDLLLDINPYCHVETWELKVSWEAAVPVREQVRKSGLVICAADSRDCRLLINKLCVEENKPLILGGLYHRAYGGQIQLIHPRQSPCYVCFLMSQGEEGEEENVRELPGAEHGDVPAYAERPVAAEPGLSVDIAPVNIMIAKLSILELLRGKPTTLGSLYEDLTASLYLWLNRREADSPYAKLEPMAYSTDKMVVLRWYGIPLERHPGCPVCGDYVGHMASRTGVQVSEEAVAAFAAR